MAYRIKNNKIYHPKACEIIINYNCNLSCRACSHLSPAFVKRFEAPEQIFNTCSILGKYYQPKTIKLVGGEPLLHPDLLQVIDAIRQSNLSNYIQVVTNGQLLANMPERFWQKIDELYISIYPGKEIEPKKLQIFEAKARLHNVSFQYFFYDNFRESYSELGTQDRNLVSRIFSTCKMAHTWKCHTVAGKYFYKCPQSVFIPQIINNDILTDTDGIEITDSPEFAKDLLIYLESNQPLSSCHYCLGSVGKLFAHEQKSRATWRSHQNVTTEDAIDMDYLAELAENPQADHSCIRYRSPVENLMERAQRFHRNFSKKLTRSQ